MSFSYWFCVSLDHLLLAFFCSFFWFSLFLPIFFSRYRKKPELIASIRFANGIQWDTRACVVLNCDQEYQPVLFSSSFFLNPVKIVIKWLQNCSVFFWRKLFNKFIELVCAKAANKNTTYTQVRLHKIHYDSIGMNS